MPTESFADLEFTPQEFTLPKLQARRQALQSLEHDLVKRCQDLCNSFECAQPDSDLTLTTTKDVTQPIRWRWRHSRLTDLPFYLVDADDKVRSIYLEPERVRTKLNYMLSAVADEHNRLQQYIRSSQALELALSPTIATSA